MSVGEIEPAAKPELRKISRKEFLGTLGVAVVGSGTALGVWDHIRKSGRLDARQRFEQSQMALFDQKVKNGMSSEWLDAAVWPGLAIVPSDVQLFSTAALLKDTEIEWPENKTAEHLGIQRPFIVGPSASLNNEPLTSNLDNGSDEVLGFWLPGSQRIAFIDRTKYAESILLPTHSTAAIYTGDRSGIVGENVALELPLSKGGLTWRYMLAKYVGSSYPGDTTIQKKVIGRSAWLTSGQVSESYFAFQSGQGNDLIQLPETK